MKKVCFAGLIILFSFFSFSCVSKTSQAENIKSDNSKIVQMQPSRTLGNSAVGKNDSRIKALYIAEPFEIGDSSEYGSSKILILYKNGEFGSMWIGLSTNESKQHTLRAFFDEVVEYGNWKENKGRLELTVQNCRCEHCTEDDGEKMTKQQMKNPVPFAESLKIENGNLGETGNLLTESNNKYRIIKENEFVFTNYDEMIVEPLSIKDYKGDRKCIAFDLEYFKK